MSDTVQYDTSETVIGGVNIANAVCNDKKLVFNESYTVAGPVLSVKSVHACYDLVILGDLEADVVEVQGSICVLGEIKVKKLSCLKTITCNSNIEADEIVCSEIIAKDIRCKTIFCSGNIIARSTIDISEALETEKAVITGEGILGSGRFSSKYAATTEYFDFNGEVIGKVIELETDGSFGEPSHMVNSDDLDMETIVDLLRSSITKELSSAGEVDENKLLKLVEQLSSIDAKMLYDWRMLTSKLVELSYQSHITNLRDYLYVVMARKLLPKEITAYETVEHVINQMFTEAESQLDTLEYSVKDATEIAYSLLIVYLFQEDIPIGHDEILDRIFQSIGIKYKTVKNFFGRN